MFTKGDKIYSDPGFYLAHKTKPIYALVMRGDESEYEERKLNTPLDIEVIGDMIFYQNKSFACCAKEKTHSAIKATLIKSRYSNDDQIALMLNKDNSEEDAQLYKKMQDWRDWADAFATRVLEVINTGN